MCIITIKLVTFTFRVLFIKLKVELESRYILGLWQNVSEFNSFMLCPLCRYMYIRRAR